MNAKNSASGQKSAAGPSPRLIDVAFTPAELEKKEIAGKTAVVIDVLRATSTIITAVDNGAAEIVAVLTPEAALAGREASAASGEAALAGGERGGVAPPGFDLGNSPLEYVAGNVRGRRVFLTTTNGTLALAGAKRGGAARVAVGAFLNASAVAEWARSRGNDVLLVCAGRRGQFSLEDTALAGFLAERIAGKDGGTEGGLGGEPNVASTGAWAFTDAAEVARLVFARAKGDVAGFWRGSEHGRFLASIGLEADLEACARVDATNTVPVLGEGKLAVAEAKAEAGGAAAGAAGGVAGGAAVTGPPRAGGKAISREDLVAAVRETADDSRLVCTHAMALARRLGVPVREVGDAANEAGIKIASCQLGCFR